MSRKTRSDKISQEERAYWSKLWWAARDNIPNHSWTTLARLLGYKIYAPNGKNSAAQHMVSAANRGYKPRSPKAQHMLKMLAGPNSATLARAIMIQRGLDPTSYEWPGESVSVLPPS